MPVLAVDADPNTCLDQTLGVQAKKTVGQIREESRDAGAGQASGISKRELMEMKIAESLVEAARLRPHRHGRGPKARAATAMPTTSSSDAISRLADELSLSS